VACACRTPPHPLVLSRAPAAAIPSLAKDVGDVYPVLNGVNGPTASAEAFADAWSARHGGAWKARFRMRLHELTKISFSGPFVPGELRQATSAELPLARAWMDAFVRDVGIPSTGADMTQRIADGQVFFFVDGEEPRTMVSWSRQTRAGCAINTVYTPPQFRGRGYATTAVAKLSETLFAAGRRFCCLYTDLAKPAPNAIYAKIGFRPLRDDTEIEFVA